MKKLTLKDINLKKDDVLSRDELRKLLGGGGSDGSQGSTGSTGSPSDNPSGSEKPDIASGSSSGSGSDAGSGSGGGSGSTYFDCLVTCYNVSNQKLGEFHAPDCDLGANYSTCQGLYPSTWSVDCHCTPY